MTDKRITEMAIELRNKDERFTGRDSVDDVVEKLLEGRLSELREVGERVEEKRAALRSRMGIPSEEEVSEGPENDAVAKQEELRERMLR
jgi:hypothetical protein